MIVELGPSSLQLLLVQTCFSFVSSLKYYLVSVINYHDCLMVLLTYFQVVWLLFLIPVSAQAWDCIDSFLARMALLCLNIVNLFCLLLSLNLFLNLLPNDILAAAVLLVVRVPRLGTALTVSSRKWLACFHLALLAIIVDCLGLGLHGQFPCDNGLGFSLGLFVTVWFK